MPLVDCSCKPIPSRPLFASLLGVIAQLLPRKPLTILPYEVHEGIVRFCIDSVVKFLDIRRYRRGNDMFDQNKVLTDLMVVSKVFYELVCREWNAYWPVSCPIPPAWFIVRPIVYFYFERVTLPVDLSPFKRLRFASLNFEEAFEYRDDVWHLLPLVSKLPDSLEEIEFLWTHAPEHDIFDLVGQLCPNITTLRLVFCTMFNHPECLWWSGHQQHMDHPYFRSHDLLDVDNYADLIALQLQNFPRIAHLHLGVYFTPFEVVSIHRVDHLSHHPIQDSREYVDYILHHSVAHFNANWAAQHPDIPPPDTNIDRLASRDLWQKECPDCAQRWAGPSERAERRAASILAVRVGTLHSVSFASFVTERRTAPSEWKVSRVVEYPSSGERKSIDQDTWRADEYPQDALLYSYTRRPGEACSSRVPLTFRKDGAAWVTGA
ncbi:hypothetical protein FRC09_015610 [Ceratobasidium sp. 395]|nr:hypothetical protein FRC09_015610 [Ceratobasidium sp. 395]